MNIFVLVVGLAILWFWNYNRAQGVELASPIYQKYGPLILLLGLGLCGGAALL